MGLRLFKTPVEPEVAPKPKEPVASTSRSAIRRQRMARGPHARLLADHRRRRALQMFNSDANPDDAEAWEVTRIVAGSPIEGDEHLRGYADVEMGRLIPRPFAVEPLSNRPVESRMHRVDLATREATREGRMSFLERQRLLRGPDGPLPPVPESRDFASRLNDEDREDFYRISALHREERARRLRSEERDAADQDARVSRVLGSLTNRSMLPWYRESTRDEANGDTDAQARQNGSSSISDNPTTFTSTFDGPTSTRGRRSAAIEEMNARRTAAQARVDGLGDRDRSTSPLYPEGEAIWDTLQTSITPDPQPPSVGSSFASSSAAAAASSNSLPQSLNTSMTTDEDPANNDCEGPDSDSAWDEDGDMPDLQGISQRLRSGFSRTYANVVGVDEEIRRAATRGRDPELVDMQRIISRLAEQTEIPDEWWAGAGLSRNVRREP
ncbi:hypothetical protein PVAG01_03761 [Phlyctema vagabunda]|uniref:Uncharacterized protein n=1 Tax=Phlyctema vagabunda TaxID=108571 RepID=A0ABR4PMC4_9HELO